MYFSKFQLLSLLDCFSWCFSGVLILYRTSWRALPELIHKWQSVPRPRINHRSFNKTSCTTPSICHTTMQLYMYLLMCWLLNITGLFIEFLNVLADYQWDYARKALQLDESYSLLVRAIVAMGMIPITSGFILPPALLFGICLALRREFMVFNDWMREFSLSNPPTVADIQTCRRWHRSLCSLVADADAVLSSTIATTLVLGIVSFSLFLYTYITISGELQSTTSWVSFTYYVVLVFLFLTMAIIMSSTVNTQVDSVQCPCVGLKSFLAQ